MLTILNKGEVESKLISANEFTMKLKGTFGAITNLNGGDTGAISYQGFFEDDTK